MPTYEYHCTVCNSDIEVEQSIKDEPLKECPKCKTAAIKRMISSHTTFALSGDCWAKDGYAKGEKK